MNNLLFNCQGVRKKSSKILPVCGVCGRGFVCVTTMKRHLVTHTGEKPFSCKVCGKQYTQKGNLRVHERTHRNDRPFECNICHQKFYRKEPMQKHQWRQHGVVYCKSRPQGPPSAGPVSQTPPTVVPASSDLPPDSPPPAVVNETGEKATYPGPQGDQNHPQQGIQQSSFVRPMSEVVVVAAASNSKWLPTSMLTLTSPSPSPSISREDKLRLSSPLLYNRLMGISMKDQRPTVNDQQILISGPHVSCELSGRPSQAEASASSSEFDVSVSASAPAHCSPKPIKLKMKFAYQKELEDNCRRDEGAAAQNEADDYDDDEFEGIPENLGDMKLRSSSASPADLDPQESQGQSADPLQCIGCNVVFPHKQDLKVHQICSDDAERPFQCCQCGYKFRQKAHLQKHQWRIHRKRFCEQDAVSTITMQDIINHGVEKSLQEMPVYHGKTSSKYYSEVLGLEYAGVDEAQAHNDAQPLDLSPVKKSELRAIPVAKIRQLENNPLLNQPPLPKPTDYSLQRSFGLSTSLPTSMPPTLPSSFSSTTRESFAVAKKQRTESAATHPNLPPIGILQKPTMVGVGLAGQKVEASIFNTYKHSSWIHNPANQAPTDLTVEKKFNQPEFLCNKLNLQGPNGRTV